MTSFSSETEDHASITSKDQYTHSGNVSPSSSSLSSDDVFSNGDARSSQSSAPSSVKGSPLTYDSETATEPESYNVRQDLVDSFSQTGLANSSETRRVVSALRRHPRRTFAKSEQPEYQHEAISKKPVPSLIRQCDRKEQFVEALVDTTTEMIEVIWPNSVAHCSMPGNVKNILGLRKFVQEVLRRSKTSYSTLQVALFYLVLLIPYVPRPDCPEKRDDPPVCRALRCGRRMFLAALILASKYLQDRNYTMQAWAKISGLKKEEICFNELAFLRTVSYELHIPEQLFKEWADIVLKYSLEDECRRARAMNGGRCEKWRAVVPRLTRDLSYVTGIDINDIVNQEQPEWAHKWMPPSSPPSSIATSRSSSPANASGFAKPPPRFLEPKALTSVELALRSPKPSKLETPCLPPINLDCAPAVNANRCPLLARSSLGQAMKQASALSTTRTCTDGFPVAPRMKSMPRPRRSCLSSASNSSPIDVDCVDSATWRHPTVKGNEFSATASLRARDSCLRASGPTGQTCDEAAFAARTLQDISRAASAYPTPRSMDSMTDASSVSSDPSEVATPKGVDMDARPLMRTSQKRVRPTNLCEGEVSSDSWLPQIAGMANIIRHAGGIPVDYGAGIEDCMQRSRHVRSASGSVDGARKRNCVDISQRAAQ